jgi:hypothetical protein
MPRLLPTTLTILLVPTASTGADPAAVPTFERDILPILRSHCLCPVRATAPGAKPVPEIVGTR